MNPDQLAQDAAIWSKMPTGTPDEALRAAAAAVAALIARMGITEPDEAQKLGAVMLTARVYRRRNSPNGIESLTEMGTSYVSRYDSDIARLLGIDAFRKPVAV